MRHAGGESTCWCFTTPIPADVSRGCPMPIETRDVCVRRASRRHPTPHPIRRSPDRRRATSSRQTPRLTAPRTAGRIGTYAMLSIRCAGPCPSSALAAADHAPRCRRSRSTRVRLLEEAYDEELARPRATAALGVAFAGIAVLAAAAGLFQPPDPTPRFDAAGSSASAPRSARPRREVAWLVFRDGLMVAGAGIALGSLGAWLLARDLGSLRHGVTVSDPVSWRARDRDWPHRHHAARRLDRAGRLSRRSGAAGAPG